MTDLKTVHAAVLEAIRTKIDELTSIKSVTVGELRMLAADKFPACYVIPGRDEEGDYTVSEILHKLRTKIVVITRSPAADPVTGMDDLIGLCGDIHDKLLEDRTLGGKCDILYFVDRDFDYMLGQDYNLFWSIITVEPWVVMR